MKTLAEITVDEERRIATLTYWEDYPIKDGEETIWPDVDKPDPRKDTVVASYGGDSWEIVKSSEKRVVTPEQIYKIKNRGKWRYIHTENGELLFPPNIFGDENEQNNKRV